MIDAKTKCVRAIGRVICPTDKHAVANVEVRLLDEDCKIFLKLLKYNFFFLALPWETDDLMGHNYTDETGNYIVEGCGDDMFSWNDPDPKIEVRHRCPEPGHTVSISFRIKE